MTVTVDEQRRRRTLERIKELDHAHRARVRSPWQSGAGLALSLRFLRTALAQMLSPTRRHAPKRVSRPPAGSLAITFVGHSTVMITTPQTRLLTDPLFSDFVFGLRRAEAACLHRADAAEVTLILISHAHRDHLHLPSLRRLSRAATVILPPRCGALVEGLGFGRVLVLEPGETFTQGDVTVTAVAARHDGRRGLGGWSWRGAAGYVVRTSALSAYFAGDTGYFSAFEEIGRTHRPDVALLPIAGYEPAGLRENNMSPLDALYALEDLGSPTLIPIGFGSFSLGYEPLSEPLRWLNALSAERGMADKVAVLGHGETLVLPRPTSRVDVPPTVG